MFSFNYNFFPKDIVLASQNHNLRSSSFLLAVVICARNINYDSRSDDGEETNKRTTCQEKRLTNISTRPIKVTYVPSSSSLVSHIVRESAMEREGEKALLRSLEESKQSNLLF